DPEFTSGIDRDHCTFSSMGTNPYFPLLPGMVLELEGVDQDDEGEDVEVSATITVLSQTEVIDGVVTRVLREEEFEDGEIIEISHNFFAVCRETGDVWYFGEDVDIYEDGEVVSHDGAWRAGVDGAQAGIQMPGSPMVGARFFQEIAPGVAEDRSEIISLDEMVTVPAGTFENVLEAFDTTPLNPEDGDQKLFAPGIGLIVDEALELVEVTFPPCMPDATTHCLNGGRFRVTAEWERPNGTDGDANAILASSDAGEFWFFNPNNTELLVKVLDGCGTQFNSFWVFAAGLTNVDVTITVTDTESLETRVYENPLGTDFEPVLDTQAFATCP
ncbi:MAG: hypothetical protein KDD47_26225, partial [Acidobacteria bacterium]|nr:hypothetical protein [Acidobacteriota bacterium]